ncbi:hypothetical protein TIFTF001_042301 [Ficus carica]|uniref:Berberine/berberine-like domain-containing protein n=1 Tax=Ficus carica TaxID=3494 RepID=A0AA88CV22_FICCA|nr:hypothetical protein TIFTF001_042299 [Ficus carica]GMN35858.1 hypothetical protein TIFTF001_042301 [Ficus carica]
METEFPELGLQRHECFEMTWIESFLFHNFFRNGESLDVLLNRKSNLHLTSFKTKSDFVTEPIPDDVVERMLGRLYEEQVGRAWFELYPYGGKMSNISESKIAFPHRAGNLYMILYYVEWDQERENITESERHVRWVRRLYNYMTPYIAKNPRATYLNFRDLDIGVNDNNNNIERASIWGNKYFKNNFKRLVRVKTKFDPTNFFTYEQSIPPLHSY